jgi:hypothetical protein
MRTIPERWRWQHGMSDSSEVEAAVEYMTERSFRQAAPKK